MNNPNPFVPKGSLLEQQSQRRSRLKLAVFCVLAVSVTGLVGMLIQGCKREKPPEDPNLNPPPLDLSTNVSLDTNYLSASVSNVSVTLPPAGTNLSVVVPPVGPVGPVEPVVPAVGSEYSVVSGDSLDKIAKKYGVKLKELQAANPSVVPTKLKIGQKLTIPAGGKTPAEASTPGGVGATVAVDAASTSYTVKSGDTLTKIAKAHGTTVKVIEAANGLSTTKIKVGQKLKIPSKSAPAPVAPAPAPAAEPMPAAAPVLPPISTPAPAPGR